MQRVRKIIERDSLIIVEVDPHTNPQRGGSNAFYLLDYIEYGQNEFDTALGKAVRERAEGILYDEPKPTEQEEVPSNGAG